MPDGSNLTIVRGVRKESVPPTYADPAMQTMHKRLLVWGLWTRGGGRDVEPAHADVVRVSNGTGDEAVYALTTTPYRETDPNYDRRELTEPEIERANNLNSRVIALPIQQSLVLQVFYFEEDAEHWHKLTPPQQEQRIRDLTNWRGKPPGVNARIERHNRVAYDNAPLIVAEAFMAIRHRAIRELCARERGIPGA